MSLSLLLSPVFLILTIYFLLKLNKRTPESAFSVGSVISGFSEGMTEEQQKQAFTFLKDASKILFNEDDKEDTVDVKKALDLKRLKNKKNTLKEITSDED